MKYLILNKVKNSKGFTLIELLVVVLVIGVLSGVVLSVINTTGIQAKGRDSERIAHLKNIQTALELYFADNRSYPVSDNWIQVTGSDSAMSQVLTGGGYINSIPTDPEQIGSNNDPCSAPTNYRYNYTTDTNGNEYMLTAMMEVETSNNGNECSALNNWGSSVGSCPSFPSTVSDVCYGVENP